MTIGREEIRQMIIEITAKDNTKKEVNSVRKSLDSVYAKVGVLGTAIGGLGLSLMVKRTLEVADSQAKFADRLGISTKALGGLQHAAGLTGVTTQNLNLGLQRMTRRVAEAATGTGEAVKALQELNLSADALSKMSPDEQFKAIADAMGGVEAQSDKVRLAFKLFDSEGVALINTLNLGAEGLDRVSAEADALGISLGRADAAKIEAANDAIARMQGALQGAAQTLTVELAPVIEYVANSLANASKEGNGFKDSIIGFVETGLTGVGYLSDAFYGWKLIFKTLETAWYGYTAIVLTGAQKLDEAIAGQINSTIADINSLIGAVNSIPGFGDVPLIANVESSGSLASMAEEARKGFESANDELWKIATEEKPSSVINRVLEEIKATADAASQSVAGVAEGRIATGTGTAFLAGGDVSEDKNAKLKEDLAKRLEILQESQMTEWEILQLDYETKEQLLWDSEERNLLNKEAYAEARARMDEIYMTKETDLIKREQDRQTEIKKRALQNQANAARNAANVMSIIQQTASMLFDSGSKKDFERNKKVQMANALVNTYAGAATALANPGGYAGIALAVATIAYGLVQVSKISSQSYQGGEVAGPTGAPSVGYGIPTTPFQQPQQVEVVTQPDQADLARTASVNYHIEVHGHIMDSDSTARALIEPLEKARLDGVKSEL